MKNKLFFYIAAAFLLGLLGATIFNSQKLQTQETEVDVAKFNYGDGINQNQNLQLNEQNCLADDCLLVDGVEYPVSVLPVAIQEALAEAINDEYKALATYEAVIAKFGATRPFSMIKGAEEQHITSLKAVYDKYGLVVPVNTLSGTITAPDTLKEACQIGVEAEIANAALYAEELIPAVKDYEDITLVFENLMNASEQKHLPSFEKCN